ncbi:hypothetical protein [Salinicola rhizosphaerae]|uniref:DUF2799 domain-containing protein n=1 Tax=Salinicola rhizosphaerae TaxID=1443141 RepID=A0ABQ3DQA2_9GAMM|nr:hypothetical protein [Salinicola rhizosphaerae]GHB11826.1 hypothetical protein GCM10009038_06750 [Salinicola rhizosphaerae]
MKTASPAASTRRTLESRSAIGSEPLRLVALLVLPALLLGGCHSSMGPMSWTSGYRNVTVADADGQGTSTRAIPNLCQSDPDQSGLITLPPGCANDLNLELMVVDPGDLTRGQEMGPAMAAPVAEAADQRLNNRERANERRAMLENEARNAMGQSATTDGL